LVKNLSFSGIAFLTLSRYNAFKNTWLERELRNYYLHDKEQDKKNRKICDILNKYAEIYNKQIIYIRDTAFKHLNIYREGSRFSTDVDILIHNKDLFHIHTYLKEQGFLLMNADFRMVGKRELYTDSFYDVFPPFNPPFHKQEIINGINRNYRTFNYYKDAFLEVHVPVCSAVEIDKTTYFKYAEGNLLAPEFELITQANHFFLHLKYNETQENRHKTFLNFLKRLTDIHYLLYKGVDMQKVVDLSIKYRVSHQIYYYLLLSKKYLHFSIPAEILKKLKKASGIKQLVTMGMLPGKKIIRDKHTPYVSFYCNNFLPLKKPKQAKPTRISVNSKEAKLLLNILARTDVYQEYRQKLPNHNSKRLQNLIKETASDGLFYHKLKNNPSVSKKTLSNLKEGYDAVLFFDNILRIATKDLMDIPVDKTFIKDSIIKQGTEYIPGTRYSCDVDILIRSGDALLLDEEMEKKTFFSDGVEIPIPDEIVQLAFQVNKDVSKKIQHYEEELFYINRYMFERTGITQKHHHKVHNDHLQVNEAGMQKFYDKIREKDKADQYNRKRKTEINRDKSINYHGVNGSYIDVHTSLFNQTPLFAQICYHPETIMISDHNFMLCPEDKIITDACHFVLNFNKHHKKYEFQGFLKYLLDYKLYTNNVDAGKLTEKAKKTNCSTQVWFYLQMLNDHLNAKVSKDLINELHANTERRQRILLKSINRRKLLFNKSSAGLIFYSKLYLENGILSRVFGYKKH
ncbi:MAG: hypothetical protein R6U19_01260, partial [Bacteroidales bacterium]